MRYRWKAMLWAATVILTLGFLPASSQGQVADGNRPPAVQTPASGGGRGRDEAAPVQGPWMERSLSPDKRAELLVKEMTIDEKINMVHGGDVTNDMPAPALPSNGGAGWVSGIPRLGIPSIQMADAAVGVTRGALRSRYSTPLPSAVSEASAWDTKLAYEYGALIGQELRDQGYNMSLGGGVNLAREPRNGRIFEYKGEDPILAGRLEGQEMKGLQSKGIIGDIKHFAFNDQETGRMIGNVVMRDKGVMRETDLLPFEIAVKDGEIGAVMGAYNKVNGDWACENEYLLNDFLKGSVGFKGFVVSDWGATHSTVKAAMNGLDMEQNSSQFFGTALKQAVEKGEVPMERLDAMVKRILRSAFAAGLFDNRQQTRVVDVFGGLEFAQRVAERGTVLLKNNKQLPLNARSIKSITVIGSHADVGVLSGGGSAQVDPPGGNAVQLQGQRRRGPVWYPSSPLKAIHAKAPRAKVVYDDGNDLSAAAAVAKASQVAIVFVNQPAGEGRDVNLMLPGDQDKLVSAVAAANPRTIVVVESGGAVLMPWVDEVSAILEAWYPGIRGGEAIANILFGDVNPSGKLVLSFAKSEADLPHAKVFGPPPGAVPPPGSPPARGRDNIPFDITYTEGLKVGYKWFDAENKTPLFAFGHGLSYTSFVYSGLKVTADKETSVSFTVKNTGKRAGIEIVQIYAALPACTGEPPKRLVAWEPVKLKAGESKAVTLTIEPLHLSIFDVDKDNWQVASGEYKFMVGGSSRNLPLSQSVKIGQ